MSFSSSNNKVEQFYNDIYSNQQEVTSMDEWLMALNPPPDTLIKLRATAFKVAGQYISTSNDEINTEEVVRKIHMIVTAIENRCYNLTTVDSSSNNNTTSTGSSDFDVDAVTTFYNQVFENGATDFDTEDNEQLLSFLQENAVSFSSSMEEARSLVFSIGQQHFTSASDKEQILRCMNVIIHAIESSFCRPKPYHIQLSSSGGSGGGGSNTSSYSAMAATTSVHSEAEEAPTSTIPTTTTTTSNNTDLSSMTLNEAVQKLWNYDANRLVMNDDLQLNVQNGKKPYVKEDAATDPLFTSVQSEVLRRSTYAAFIHLLDNYTPSTGTTEQVTTTERSEIDSFLSIIMETAPMQFCLQYCKAHDILSSASDSPTEFKELLYEIWFEPYTRDGNHQQRDSSGFEHVFIGEIQDNEISGFHNWIQFYVQEQKGNIDYRGYVKPRGHNQLGHDSDDHILTLQFAWKSPLTGQYVEKFVGTMFVGVSPEFEMALYTMCFLFGNEENQITLDTGVDIFELVIKCYTMARRKIGTTFPEVNSHYGDDDN